MIPFFELNQKQLIVTIIVLVVWIILKLLFQKIIVKFGKITDVDQARTRLVVKYTNMLLASISLLAIFLIWGVDTGNILAVISAISAVIGVAFFAQWSILSNVTAGIILFFNAPFRIGNIIRIHDKDFPIEAEIVDIKGFHTFLKTKEGELILFPNSLMLQKGVSLVESKEEKLTEFMD